MNKKVHETPYGKLSILDIQLKEVYKGKAFPIHAYQKYSYSLIISINHSGKKASLSLPCDPDFIRLNLYRAGIDKNKMSIDIEETAVDETLLDTIIYGLEISDIFKLNKLWEKVVDKEIYDKEKLYKFVSIMEITDANTIEKICDVIDHLDRIVLVKDFDLIEYAKECEPKLWYGSNDYYRDILHNSINYEQLGKNLLKDMQVKKVAHGYLILPDTFPYLHHESNINERNKTNDISLS